jgi:hypothetical protein
LIFNIILSLLFTINFRAPNHPWTLTLGWGICWYHLLCITCAFWSNDHLVEIEAAAEHRQLAAGAWDLGTNDGIKSLSLFFGIKSINRLVAWSSADLLLIEIHRLSIFTLASNRKLEAASPILLIFTVFI